LYMHQLNNQNNFCTWFFFPVATARAFVLV
jgi:hypothetical protein